VDACALTGLTHLRTESTNERKRRRGSWQKAVGDDSAGTKHCAAILPPASASTFGWHMHAGKETALFLRRSFSNHDKRCPIRRVELFRSSFR
jgi:hypothetical protein